ncbi:MAG: DNA primase [Acidobacteriota bacterium]|nr:DNA primase [Acidobacteriota bacterium]
MDFVEQLKSSIDIVKVVGEYVRLRRVGATGRYLGLCPFHQEKTPSFNVNQSRQFYKCFGCGAGGDVLKFIMEVDGLTFPETLKLLSERHGIPMPQRPEYSDADSKLRGALHEMHAIALKMYRAALHGPQGGEARAYLDQRGVSAELIETFELGYSDPQGQALTRKLQEERFSPEQMEASGLVRRRNEGTGHFDAFRGRLMFPIHNESGKVIAFGARALSSTNGRPDDQPKYLNSPETPIYRKTSTLYNLHHARDAMRKSNRAVLVEGYMDVIGVFAAGVKEVVASCGTALTNTQVRALHRHADTVVVNFDPDDAGATAAERAIQLLLDEGLHVKVLAFGGGGGDAAHAKLDPYEYVKQFGPEAYRAQLDSASSYFHWLADRARVKFDMRGADGRMDAFKFLLPAVQKISDKLERAAVASDLAGYLGVEPGLVLEQFKKAATERHAPGQVAAPQPKRAAPQIPALERILLNTLLSSVETRQQILPRLPLAMTAGFVTREVVDTLRQMAEAGPVSFTALDARLSDTGSALLHLIAAADEIADDNECLAQADACLRRLQANFQRDRLNELRARVKTAGREGRSEEALHWTAELQRLEEEVKREG